MSYKYTTNPSSQIFIIFSFLIFLAYIFSKFISLKYYCMFSLYKVTEFTIEDSSRPSNGIFYRYQDYRLLDLLGITCYYHSYWSPTRHYLLLQQLLVILTYQTPPATTTITSYHGLLDITCC